MHIIIRALVLLLACSILAPRAHAAPGLPAAPALVAPQPDAPPLLDGEPAPVLRGTLAMRTYSLDFYRLPGGLSAPEIQQLALLVEQTMLKTTGKLGIGWLHGRVAIRFEPAQTGPCAIRGLTLSSDRTIRLFYAPGSDPQRIINILSHELVHQLQHDRYGTAAHLRSDNILLEGMATWASSDYFLAADGRPLYQVRARQALADGTLLPLATDLVADCRTATRVNIYDEWASFVEFLLTTYGRDKLDALYRSGTGRAAGSADYAGVYGTTLAALEAEWIAWLRQR